MTNAKLAAFAASLMIVTAPAMAKGGKSPDGPKGGIEASINWSELGASDDGRADNSSTGSYHVQMNEDEEFGLEGTFADKVHKIDPFGLDPDNEWSALLAEGKPFGDGSNLLFRETGEVETSPAVGVDALKNMRGWRVGGGYERLLTDTLSLRLSREYTTFGKDFDQWETKAGILVKF
ncbi:hypothetical protein [Kordiimonas sp.]|uniref:hypothetical protein n=1 Tax=Kordiimonas sp. TaxID=1970157 RepID=UPI003A8E89F9